MENKVIGDAVDFSGIRRVLVVKLQHLGDVLLTTPTFSVLKQQYPHLEIDVLVYRETAVMLKGNPDIDTIHTIDRSWKKQGVFFQLRQELELLGQLRKRRYELIINLTDRWRGAGLTRLLKPRYSVSQPYPHRRGKAWRRSFTHIYRVPQQNRHTVENNLDALRRLGVSVRQYRQALTFVAAKEAVDKVNRMIGSEWSSGKKIIVIHPTSRWMFKAWHVDGFARVIDGLYESGHCPVLISGPTDSELDYAASIKHRANAPFIDLSGQLSLEECGALIEKADCFLGLDSVAMHIAAAMNTPSVVLFGPTKEKIWGPWLVRHEIITEKTACRPCDLKGCGDGMVSECIRAIRPQVVIQAVQELTAGNPP